MRPLPCSARSEGYIPNGAKAFLFIPGNYSLCGKEDGTVRQIIITMDVPAQDGMVEFFYKSTMKIGCCGRKSAGLLSVADYRWFRALAKEHGTDIDALRALTRQGNEDVSYMLLWLECAAYLQTAHIRDCWRAEQEAPPPFYPNKFLKVVAA